MAKGFGGAFPQTVSLVSTDMFEIGRDLRVCQLKGKVLVEIGSLARLVCKSKKRAAEWIEQDNVQSWEVTDISTGLPVLVTCVELGGVQDFLEYERESDNPHAAQLMSRAVSHGIDHQIQKAIAEGKSYLDTPFGRIRFTEIDGQIMLRAEDIAGVLGTTTEEMAQEMQSPEFQEFVRQSHDPEWA